LNSPPKLGGVPARPSSSTKGRAGGVVPKQVVARFYLGTTPSAPALVASRHFINGAATPPNLGGELSRLKFVHTSMTAATVRPAMLELFHVDRDAGGRHPGRHRPGM